MQRQSECKLSLFYKIPFARHSPFLCAVKVKASLCQENAKWLPFYPILEIVSSCVAKLKPDSETASAILSGLERRVSIALATCKSTSWLNIVKVSSSFFGRGCGGQQNGMKKQGG